MNDVYPPGYFKFQKTGSLRSAQIIVPLVLSRKVTSVLDVGCGTGTWLKVFKEFGVNDVFGVDGKYINKNLPGISKNQFLVHDLTKPLDLRKQFDLVISLEVAEHLPKNNAGSFIKMLTDHSKTVLFSAAIPFQGGPGHVNEQWPDYWNTIFAKHGFKCFDLIRDKIWDNDDVEWWYRQNIMIFSKENLGKPVKIPRSLVHPKCFLETVAVCPPNLFTQKRYGWSPEKSDK